MHSRYRSILSYADIVQREGIMLQRGMNYRIKPDLPRPNPQSVGPPHVPASPAATARVTDIFSFDWAQWQSGLQK